MLLLYQTDSLQWSCTWWKSKDTPVSWVMARQCVRQPCVACGWQCQAEWTCAAVQEGHQSLPATGRDFINLRGSDRTIVPLKIVQARTWYSTVTGGEIVQWCTIPELYICTHGDDINLCECVLHTQRKSYPPALLHTKSPLQFATQCRSQKRRGWDNCDWTWSQQLWFLSTCSSAWNALHWEHGGEKKVCVCRK